MCETLRKHAWYEHGGIILEHLEHCHICGNMIAYIIQMQGEAIHFLLGLVYDLNKEGYHVIPFHRDDLNVQGVAQRFFHGGEV